MSFKIYNTEKWSAEQMAPYFDNVIKSIAYFNQKFPDDYNTETILNDILKGEKVLWIIVDAHENFMVTGTCHWSIKGGYCHAWWKGRSALNKAYHSD